MSSIPFSELPVTTTLISENKFLVSQSNSPLPGRTSRTVTLTTLTSGIIAGIAAAGITFTGNVIVPTPTDSAHATTKEYVDTAVGAGGTPRYLYNNGYIGFGVTNDGVAASSSYWIAKAIDNTVNGPEFHVFSSQTNMAGKMYAKGTGDLIFGNNLSVGILRLNANLSTAVNKFYMSATPTGNYPIFGSEGSDTNISMNLTTKGTGSFNFYTSAMALLQFKINSIASALNYLTVAGAATGNSPTFASDGTNTDVGINFASKGAGNFRFQTSTTLTQFGINHVASAVNYWVFSGSATANAISFTATGADTNIGVNYNAKGTGVHTFNTNVIAPAPTSNTHLTTKQYVDNAIAAASSGGTPRYLYHNSSIGFGVTNPAATTIASYWEAQGVATGGTPVLAINSSDTNSSGILLAKGTGSLTLSNGSGNLATFSNAASTINYLSFVSSAAASAVAITALGSDTSIGINHNTKGGGVHNFNTNSSVTQFQVSNVTSAVNYLIASGGATSANANLTAFGSDTNVGITYLTRNAGSHVFSTNNATSIHARIIHTNSVVNYLDFSGSATGNALPITANGSDSNISIRYLAKGSAAQHIYSINATDVMFLKLNSLSLGTDGAADDMGIYLYPRSTTNVSPRFRSRGYRTDGNTSQSFGGAIVLEGVRTDAMPASGKVFGSVIFGGNADNATTTTPGMVYPASIAMLAESAWTSSAAAAAAITFNTGITGPTAINTPNVSYGTEQARITSVGDFLLGTTSSSYSGTNQKVFHINAASNPVLGFGISGSNAGSIIAYASAFSIRTEGTRYIALQTGNLEQVRISHTANAVNYLSITGSATGGFLPIAAAGSDTNVGISFATKGAGIYAFNTNTNVRQFKIGDIASSVNYIAVYGAATTGFPILLPEGSDTDIGLYLASKNAGSIFLRTGSSSQFSVTHTASAANYLSVTGAAVGNTPILSTVGADSAINMGFATKGVGFISFFTNTNLLQFRINNTASAVNYISVTGSATGIATQLLAAGSDTNISLALSPKGTGALQAQINDGTATGGNTRGTYALDLQLSRSTATQIASGSSAVTLGSSNTASAQYSAVLSGNASVSSGVGAVIAGGDANTVNNSYCWIPGGQRASSLGVIGRGAWASGRFALNGDAQAGEYVLRRQTVDATATRITSDANTQTTNNTANLSDNSTYLLQVMVVARQTGGTAGTAGDSAGWILWCLMKRGSGVATTTLVGTASKNVIAKDTAASTWDVSVTADTTNGGVNATVTAEANKNVNWVSRILSIETIG